MFDNCISCGMMETETAICSQYEQNERPGGCKLMNYEQIKTAAEGYKADMAKFLRDMIRIPSESCEEEGVV